MAALDGMRILDLTQLEAGPSCTQLLAWLGAEVVKIEPLQGGEPGRRHDGDGDSLFFLSHNSNKRSVAIDLKAEAGRELFLRLVPRFDVLVENFRLGAMDDLGIGYETLRTINQRLVYATIKGFGTSEPYAKFPSFDAVALATGGAFSITGHTGDPPVRPGPSFGDTGAGLVLASGILAAYLQALRTGEGQVVEVSMQEAVLHTLRSALTHAEHTGGAAVPRAGNGNGAPTNLYPCSPGGENDYVYIRVASDDDWRRLAVATGQPRLGSDERFATMAARLRYRTALFELIAQWTMSMTKYQVMETLADVSLPCGAVLDSKDLFEDRHLRARGAIVTLDHPVRGEQRFPGPPLRMSASPMNITAAPLLGADTNDVLGSELGLDVDTLRKLAEGGVIGGAKTVTTPAK